jgi:2-aminoadipate transaminase
MDTDGAMVDELPELIERVGRPKLIYVIPTFHNPSGVTMSLGRRQRLIKLADELGAVLVEDDAYGPFRFTGDPIPSLAALSDDVVTVRSLSKVVAPGLRVGCVIGPTELLRRLEHARGGTDICTSPLNQEVVARFIGDGAVIPHVERLTALFAARCDAMIEALEREFGDRDIEWTRPQGGMFLWARLPEGFDTRKMLEPAIEEGVAFVPGTVFSSSGRHARAMRLCFASVDSEGIGEGIRRLRRAYDRIAA